MKKIIFLIFSSVLLSVNCFAQNTIILNDWAQIDMPSGMENINHDQARLHAEKYFSSSPAIRNSILHRKTNHLFRVNGILISLVTNDHPVNADHLSKMKLYFDYLLGRDSTNHYNASIYNVNNNSVLVIKSTVENVVNYRFFEYNSSYTKAVTGILEFKSTEDKKATSLLHDLISGIKFKDS